MMENLSDSEKLKLSDNIKSVIYDVKNTSVKCGRGEDDVDIMAVTKTIPFEIVNLAIDCGIKLLGENRVQEYLSKKDYYNTENVEIHMIGKLQRNKVKYIYDNIDVIESVDSIELATEIDKRCRAVDKIMPVFVEIKLGDSDTKGGVTPENTEKFICKLSNFGNISVQGLMSIPPFTTENAEQRRYFNQMYKLFIDIRSKNIDNTKVRHLSMGMSGDYHAAIAEGATQIRLGTVLFGSR